MLHIRVNMTPQERMALNRLSDADLRPVQEVVRYLVREEARRRGLWPEPATLGRVNTASQ